MVVADWSLRWIESMAGVPSWALRGTGSSVGTSQLIVSYKQGGDDVCETPILWGPSLTEEESVAESRRWV